MAGRAMSTPAYMMEIHDMLKNTTDELLSIWSVVYGTESNIIEDRIGAFKEALQDVFTEMINEEQDTKNDCITKIESLRNEALELERQLLINVPYSVGENDTLVMQINKLENDLKEYREMRDKRLNKLKELQEKEVELCIVLEINPQYSELKDVPSEELLNDIVTHNTNMKNTLVSAQTRYSNTRKNILELWKSLQLEPKTNYEKEIYENKCCNNLGEDSLAKLQKVSSDLEDKKEQMKVELDELKKTLSTLWNRLETDNKIRERFIMKFNGQCNQLVIDAYKKEIEINTALKLKMISKIIGRVRLELQDWWDHCHYGEEQRANFKIFHIEDNLTEQMLEEHEQEVEKLKQFYEENKEMINMIERRFELWHKMLDLELKATDKERLFKNRGCQLLMEEKERKFIQKELPKIEKGLEKEFEKYEAKFGTPYLFDGIDVREAIKEQWDSRNQSKENQKNARKNVVSTTSVKKGARLLNTPANNTTRSTPGRNATLKRKLDPSPVTNSLKRGRILEDKKANGAVVKGRNVATKANVDESGSPASSVLSYSLFQNQLDVDEGTAINSTFTSVKKSTDDQENIALNSTRTTRRRSNTKKRSTPVKKTPISKISNLKTGKIPMKSKLLSPKVQTKSVLSSANKLVARLATPKGTTNVSHNGHSTLSRSRTHTRLTPSNPRHKLPIIF